MGAEQSGRIFRFINNEGKTKLKKDINEHVNTIYFQRISVIVTDVIYLLMLLKVYKSVDVELVVSFFSLNFLILDSI